MQKSLQRSDTTESKKDASIRAAPGPQREDG